MESMNQKPQEQVTTNLDFYLQLKQIAQNASIYEAALAIIINNNPGEAKIALRNEGLDLEWENTPEGTHETLKFSINASSYKEVQEAKAKARKFKPIFNEELTKEDELKDIGKDKVVEDGLSELQNRDQEQSKSSTEGGVRPPSRFA